MTAATRTVLCPIPDLGFDPTEAGVPWQALTRAGHRVVFATPDGAPGRADPIMVTGVGLGLLAPLLRADANGRAAYAALEADAAFRAPIRYDAADVRSADALLLPGGHAKGMRVYLEAPALHALVAAFFAADKPVAAICHGVVLAARARSADSGRSVLHGRRTTALPSSMEMLAHRLTRAWMGDYYRTYPDTTVEDEVTAALARPGDFVRGPPSIRRDTPGDTGPGFVVRDGRYLSARWPGDAHRFAAALLVLLGE
jgi:protease I